jgi:hypothetical protein
VKITRLKRGYRIRCSDSEFAALSLLVTYGHSDMEALMEEGEADLSPAQRRGLRTITGPGSWYAEDRRTLLADSNGEAAPRGLSTDIDPLGDL